MSGTKKNPGKRTSATRPGTRLRLGRISTNKKAIFFSVDGMFAALLLILAVLLMPHFLVSGSKITSTAFLSQDAVSLLAEFKVSEINSSYTQALIANGTIADPNQTVMEQIGELWSQNLTSVARNLSKEVLNQFLDNYAVYVDGDLIYSSGNSSDILISSKRMVSGISKDRAKEGFNARAIAKKVNKNTTSIFRFHPQGSGHKGGQGVEITKQINLTAGQIHHAWFYLSIHYGISNIASNRFFINGINLNIQANDWLYVVASNITGGGHHNGTNVAFTKVNISDKLVNGTNNITIELLSQTGGHAHLHPGTRIEVTHDSSAAHEVNETVVERVYFDHILSKETGQGRSGAWAVLPIDLPSSSTLSNAALHLVAQDIEPYTPAEVLSRGKGDCSNFTLNNSYNLRVYMNNDTVELANDPAWLTNETINRTYNLTSFIQDGTNVASVYLNSYADCFWGDGNTILSGGEGYSSQNSSYVEITYTKGSVAQEYGKIDVNIVEEFNTSISSNVTKLFYLNGTVIESFIELTTLETQTTNISVNNNPIFQTPRLYTTPSSIYVDPSYLSTPDNNTFILQECALCQILGETAYSYQLLIPNQVGYGSTFDTKQEALQDAATRLDEALGSHVDAFEIENETISVGGVPSLWGPTLVEVRVWG